MFEIVEADVARAATEGRGRRGVDPHHAHAPGEPADYPVDRAAVDLRRGLLRAKADVDRGRDRCRRLAERELQHHSAGAL